MRNPPPDRNRRTGPVNHGPGKAQRALANFMQYAEKPQANPPAGRKPRGWSRCRRSWSVESLGWIEALDLVFRARSRRKPDMSAVRTLRLSAALLGGLLLVVPAPVLGAEPAPVKLKKGD